MPIACHTPRQTKTMTAPVLTKTPLQRAKDAYNARNGDHALKLAAAMMQDDQWLGGAGWNGPLPRASDPADVGGIARLTAEIKREFVSQNMTDNLVTRHVHGIAGREPRQGVRVRRTLKDDEKPNPREQAQIDEFWAAYSDWWDNSGVWLDIQQTLKNAVWSGKGTLRLFIQRGKLKQVGLCEDGQPLYGVPAGLTLADALGYISVHAPEWNAAGVVRDGDRRVMGAYYRWADEQKQERWELMERAKDKNGTTITRVTPNATDSESDAHTDYPVSDLMIFEVSLNPLIKSSIIALSKFLNKTLTMGSRNINLGGFVERTILNAQMPGKTVDGKFIPDAYEVGLGSTGYIAGLPVKRVNPDTGRTEDTGGYTTPSIVYKDPIQWEGTFGKTIENVREMLFDEAKQLHVLITGDATANGVSRQQAVNDFMTSLEPTRMALEQLLRWLMTTVLGLGLHFTGRSAEWDAFKATASARASAVQPTSAEIETARNLRKDGLISLKSFYARIGIDDPETMRAEIAAEGITPDMALVLIASGLPAYVGLRAAQQAWPSLKITDEDVNLQRALDLADTSGDLIPATDPNADPTVN